MKVAFIHPFLFRYARGIERYLVNLSNALVQEGHAVDVLTWRWPQPIGWDELDARVGVRTLPTSRYYAAKTTVPFYVSHFLHNKYDHVYIFFADYGESATLSALFKLRRDQPYSIVLHFPYSQVPHRYHAFVESGLVERAKDVIAVSQFVADEAKPILGRSCIVIGHGVDTDRFRPNPVQRTLTHQQLDIAQDAPVLLTVSALEERKGVKWVLPALPDLLKPFPNLRYVIVGDGPYEDQLRQQAITLGLESNVTFIPATTDVGSYYQAADIMLILSKGEASSIVSLEAMACCVPVIASLHPPFDELIESGWGIQIDERDCNQVTETIRGWLTQPELRVRLGTAGRKRVQEEHTWPEIAKSYCSYVA